MIQIKEEQTSVISSVDDFAVLLKHYLSKGNVPEKLINLIVDKGFLRKNPSYYMYYPYLFNTIFKVNHRNKLEALSVAGFLYYKAIILLDSVFDTKSSHNLFEQYLISDICKEESIKILSSLFPIESTFWKSWNSRKLQYAEAYHIDQKSHNIHSFDDYEQLADFKCAFGKVAIDALYQLSDQEDIVVYKNVLDAHKLFYTAFQIVDDISDIKEDLDNGQFNIAIFELQQRIGKEEVNKKSIDEIKKELYLKGIINELYDKALGYLKKTRKCIEHYNLADWKFELQKLNNTIVKHQLNVDGYIKVFFAKANLSLKMAKREKSIEETLELGSVFIRQSQDQIEGKWYDYFKDAGIGDVWTTAFVVSNFADQGCLLHQEAISKGIQFLKRNVHTNQIWGYNKKWISDADTTSFVMRAFLKHNQKISKEALDTWYTYQNKDGGFGKYNNDKAVLRSLNFEKISNVDGWTQSHFCVSAAAYMFFCEAQITNDRFLALRSYLVSNLMSECTDLSYWWTEDIYSFHFLIKGSILSNDDKLLDLVISNFDTYIKSEAYKKLLSERNFFYLGILLECLTANKGIYNQYIVVSKEILKFLISNQLDDGSWKESYSMRIPYPSCISPNTDSIAWKRGDQGINVITSDFHRLFSTSSSLSAIRSYWSMC